MIEPMEDARSIDSREDGTTDISLVRNRLYSTISASNHFNSVTLTNQSSSAPDFRLTGAMKTFRIKEDMTFSTWFPSTLISAGYIAICVMWGIPNRIGVGLAVGAVEFFLNSGPRHFKNLMNGSRALIAGAFTA